MEYSCFKPQKITFYGDEKKQEMKQIKVNQDADEKSKNCRNLPAVQSTLY